jgi:hypothetical protein
MNIRLLATGLMALFALGPPALSAPPPSKDTLTLASIVPTGAVRADAEVEFTIEVDVTLETADEAWLHLGFNVEEPNRYRMVSQYLLYRGMERVVIKGKAVPRNYGRTGDFAAILNIGPRKEGVRYSPTTSLRQVIPVVP